MNFIADNFDDLYASALIGIINHGEQISPRGMMTKELRGVKLTLTEPTNNIISIRPLNYRFMIAEFLWILTGQNRAELISKFNSKIGSFSDDGHHMSGAYGPPIADQMSWIIHTLQHDPDTRQAVLTIWRPRPMGSKDIPCTVMMHFMLRNNSLEMVTYMRSNDAWLGLPYDLFTFTMIQRYVACAIGSGLGPYHHMVGSFHLYEANLGIAANALNREPRRLSTTSLIPTYPWPLEVLEVLISAPNDLYPTLLDSDISEGWRNILSWLTPVITPPTWARLIKANGIEPKGWKEYVP